MSTQAWVDWYPLLLKDLLKINPQATKTDKKIFDAIIKGLKIRKKQEFDYTYCSVISHIHKNGNAPILKNRIQILKDILNSKVEFNPHSIMRICVSIQNPSPFCNPKDSNTANLFNQICRTASDITKADRKSLIIDIQSIVEQTNTRANISEISKILFVLNPTVFIPITRKTRAYVKKEFGVEIRKRELSADDYFCFLENLDMKNKKSETYAQIYTKACNRTPANKPASNSDSSFFKSDGNEYNKYMDQVEKRLRIAKLESKDSESFESIEYEEGGKKLQFHYAYERDPGIRKDFLEKINKDKRYSCAVCGFSFFKKYGELALNEDNEEFIEVHHKFPLSNGKRIYKPESITGEFVCLCPNCHRMIHRYLNKLIHNGKITKKNYESQIEDLKKNLKK